MRNPDPTAAEKIDWDAGSMGCGELVLELRLRFRERPPRSLFHLIAEDPGAPEDLPAWSRMTGHALERADHPHYWFRLKE